MKMDKTEQLRQTFSRTDHDLLIEVSANVRNLTDNISQYNTASVKSIADHESRLRIAEKSLETITASKRGSSVTVANIYTVLATIAAIVMATIYIINLFKR